MKMKSVMNHRFSEVPSADIQRSSFNRSHGYKTTFDSGYLVPFFCDEVLPGDTFKLKTALFARLATPIVPFMDNLFLETFYFFVPNRLLWDNWKKFNGEQKNPGDSTDYLVPQLKAPSIGFETGSIFDYFGIPTGVGNISVNALHFRAYNFIFNEWFRDENLQKSEFFYTGDEDEGFTQYGLLRRNKRHDYFTSCLPWPQKGPGVELPLGGVAPVIASDKYPRVNIGANSKDALLTVSADGHVMTDKAFSAAQSIKFATETGLQADLTHATATTINSLRQAFQLQKLYERDARGGTRYTEIIRSHFRVVSPDARLQRPEYLGGSSQRININPVQQTSAQKDQPTPQGNLAAFGLVSDVHHGFSKSFTEHGVIIGLVNVRADLTYQRALNRMWSRQTRWDYYWPALAHLGEQAVLNKEIYAQGDSGEIDNKVFGYQERYAEYRYKPSLITGKMNSHASGSLHNWHLSQKFDGLPSLNERFIQDNPPIKRVIAVQEEPEFILDAYFNLHCIRPMPLYSVPGLTDHF